MNGRGDINGPQGLCLVSFSKNSDHQNTLFSMYSALCGVYQVATVSAEGPVSACAVVGSDNHYVACPDRPGICKGAFNAVNILRAIKAVRDTGCGTVYFESVHLWNLFVMLMLRSKHTFVQTIHDVIPHDGSRSVLLCQKLLCHEADRVVIKSYQFVNDAKKLYHLTDAKLEVLGVWRAYPSVPTPPVQGDFLFFGRLRRYKGLPAICQVVSKCPSASFIVVGEPDASSVGVAESIARMKNVKATLRTVSDDEMAQAFESAGWVLLPYESASQSGVIIDAYRFGKPVIAFAVGAVVDQVVDGKTGFLIPPGDIEAFISAVSRAASMSYDAYERFSKSAFEFGRAKYAATSLAEELINKFNVAKVVSPAEEQV